MPVLIAIALKSLLIGGLTLGLLHLMRNRSAAERSWVAHVGLLALMIMAFAPLLLPSWNVEAPAMLGRAPAPAIVQPAVLQPAVVEASAAPLPKVKAPGSNAVPITTAPQPQPRSSISSIDPVAAATAAYAVPAAVLLFITFLALARLVALQARAEVLVDGHWLSALARAQRRMGFKHGTALLTSNELASPISWGLIRPVILLNSRAVEATAEAEAIIAHELAHVARLDWIKLLLARFATALFWFNPLVWLLAREAHQLREETADDTVLAANIADTDYAQLLVGVARHECPGLLLGAHGVAPSKSSLARRVARVLDGKSVRGPVARSFAMGVFAGAVLVAAPLAALTLTPAARPSPAASFPATAHESALARADQAAPVHADLPHIIAQGVSASVTTAMAAVAPAAKRATAAQATASAIARADSSDGSTVAVAPNGSSAIMYPPDAHGRVKLVARAANGAMAVTWIDQSDPRVATFVSRHGHDGKRFESSMVGVTPEFVAAIRAAAPRLARASVEDLTGLRAVGVSPEYARSLASVGLSVADASDLIEAHAVGLDAAYVAKMKAAGVRGDIDDFIQLRAVRVDPAFAARASASGARDLDAGTLLQLRALRTPAPSVPPHAYPRKERDHGLPAPDPDPNPDDG